MADIPYAGIAQGILGVGQAIFGGAKARSAQKQLEGMVNNYKPSESIMDFYSKALNKYNANPYQSNMYNQSMRTAGRNLTTGISALQDRRSALAGVSNLVQGANDASQNAAARAEQQQSQDLAQLGQATSMKDREDKYKFEAKYNLLSQKAGAASQGANAGISNLMGGIGSIQDYALINKMYGGSGGGVGSNGKPSWGTNYKVPNY
jgi:hypothetical protein